MEPFARLLDALVVTPARNRKIELLERYFRQAPDPDRGWALAALSDGLPLRLPLKRILVELMAQRVDPVLYKLSRDYVGDTAETVALLWPDAPGAGSPPALGHIVESLKHTPTSRLGPVLAQMLDTMTATQRWALLKLVGGAPRVGVSARLVKTALASALGSSLEDVEEVWHAVAPPYAELFAWLEGKGQRPALLARPVFRPMMLAHPLADEDVGQISPEDFIAEWKWDGIRVQIAAVGGEVRLFSRTGDDITAAFPDVAAGFAGREVTLDGELLVVRDGVVAPFSDLQQRLNRKVAAARLLEAHPAHVRLYDMLLVDGDDVRPLALIQRRRRLEEWHATTRPPRTDLSALIAFEHASELVEIRGGARAAAIEGLMLKRKSGPYLAGRVRGHWYKWKRDALTVDCVMMYAQRGSGKRSSLYSDYTFGVWTRGDGGTRALVPVGKAYSGMTDEELQRLDRFVRQSTTETFGPVRAVKPELVLEIAFDAVQLSRRHKSGVAMRFPRINRIRWDKPAADADTLDTLTALISSASGPSAG
jgi:DNA ligase-1